MEALDAIAEFFGQRREYSAAESQSKLMSLLDGQGEDRAVTIAFQRAIGMSADEADGYIASVKRGKSGVYDAFWRHYDRRKKEAACRADPSLEGCDPAAERRARLENPRDFADLAEYALTDDTLSDDELDAIARYLGGAETAWKDTREKVLSLLDDVKSEHTADRATGRKFQRAIAHDESDGVVGSKTIGKFWQLYRERRQSATPSSPAATASVATDAEKTDLPLASAATPVAEAMRSGRKLSIAEQARIIAYVRGDASNMRALVREAAWRALPSAADRAAFMDRTQGEVRAFIARAFEFAFDASIDEAKFLAAFVAATARGRSAAMRRQNKLVTFGESVGSKSDGRHANPRALRAAIERHASADDGTDWEEFARSVLAQDIPGLRRMAADERDSRKGRVLQEVLEGIIKDNLTVAADVAAMATTGLTGFNDALRAKDRSSAKETGNEISLDTPAKRTEFLRQAETASKPGYVYYGGMADSYRASFPSVNIDAAERLLSGKNALGIARMIATLSADEPLAGYSQGKAARGELQQLRGLMLAVYRRVSEGTLSPTDARFSPAARDGSTDILRERETLTEIGRIIRRDIGTDHEIVADRSSECYIGPISVADPDADPRDLSATPFVDAERLRRTHVLRGKLDTPALQVSVDGRLYVIEYRSPEGWTVVPPSDALLGGKGVVIPSINKDGIASALYDAMKLVRGSK